MKWLIREGISLSTLPARHHHYQIRITRTLGNQGLHSISSLHASLFISVALRWQKYTKLAMSAKTEVWKIYKCAPSKVHGMHANTPIVWDTLLMLWNLRWNLACNWLLHISRRYTAYDTFFCPILLIQVLRNSELFQRRSQLAHGHSLLPCRAFVEHSSFAHLCNRAFLA